MTALNMIFLLVSLVLMNIIPVKTDFNGLKNGRLWNGFRNGCLAVANCRGRFFSVIIDHIRNSRLWDEFTNLCSKIANYRGSFFPGLKDFNGLKNGGLWPGFRNGCIGSANCRGRFCPVIKAIGDVNDGITKRNPVQDDSITAQSCFSWLNMNCGADFEMFNGNGLQCA